MQPKETDAVLGGNSPPPINGVVFGGIEGLKRRYQDRPELEIASEIAIAQLLPNLCRHFERHSKITNYAAGAMATKVRSFYLADRPRVVLRAATTFQYGDPIKVYRQGQIGVLSHQGLLFGDRVEFVPNKNADEFAPHEIRAERIQVACRVLLEAAIALTDGKALSQPKIELTQNHTWWATLNNGVVFQVSASSNWLEAHAIAAIMAYDRFQREAKAGNLFIVKMAVATTEGREVVTEESGDYLIHKSIPDSFVSKYVKNLHLLRLKD